MFLKVDLFYHLYDLKSFEDKIRDYVNPLDWKVSIISKKMSKICHMYENLYLKFISRIFNSEVVRLIYMFLLEYR